MNIYTISEYDVATGLETTREMTAEEIELLQQETPEDAPLPDTDTPDAG
jgi:hypothetical protein